MSHASRRWSPSDPREWRLEQSADGYWIMDEYAEEVCWAGTDYRNAQIVLAEMIQDEIDAREQEGPRDPPDLLARADND
jgi:hypothetical protein